MTTPATPLLDHLEQQDTALLEARTRPRDVKTQADRANADAERIREELTEAFANGDTTAEAKLTRAKCKAEARAAEPWAERITGAERAVNRLQAERDNWINKNIHELLRELTPDAHAAVASITTAINALEAARQQWHAVEQRVANVVQPSSIDMRDVPNIGELDQAVRDLRRGPQLPAPLPSSVHGLPSPHQEARDAVHEAVNDARNKSAA